MSFPDIETIYIVEEPGMDRRTLWLRMSREFYQQIKNRGGKVFKVQVVMNQPVLRAYDKELGTSMATEMKDPP